jgi:hypothetical protein
MRSGLFFLSFAEQGQFRDYAALHFPDEMEEVAVPRMAGRQGQLLGCLGLSQKPGSTESGQSHFISLKHKAHTQFCAANPSNWA